MSELSCWENYWQHVHMSTALVVAWSWWKTRRHRMW